ncbi:MAG: aminotransferase class III-fold pyridoxal phosphate-dependent enzyme [SAR202 cluster bacterium]|nr:aminotransferase class III-fold pyridoxal phosphate-dependent enzyme [SAR202 cluster bacterium]
MNADWLALDNQFRLQARPMVPIVLDRGQGTRMWDVEGREYLDLMSGQACTTTGHCDPELTQAINEQAGRLVRTGIPFTTPQEVLLAKKLDELAPSVCNLGGGLPLSAVMVTKTVGDGLEAKGFLQISSHGGNPFLCAAGLATIEITGKRDLLGNTRRVGAYLRAGLEELANAMRSSGTFEAWASCWASRS